MQFNARSNERFTFVSASKGLEHECFLLSVVRYGTTEMTDKGLKFVHVG